jgi:hypothetical protein
MPRDLLLTGAGRLLVEAQGGTTMATVQENTVNAAPPPADSGHIVLRCLGATLNASLYYNRVLTGAATGSGAGILADYRASADGLVKIHANEVRGSFSAGGILVAEGLGGNPASTFSARVYNNVVLSPGPGIAFGVFDGTIDAQVLNNTVAGAFWAVRTQSWPGGGAGARVNGTVRNNLLTGVRGIEVGGFAVGFTNDYNLINVSSGSNVTLGPNTITAPGLLAGPSVPRPLPGSPAIDAADTGTLAFGLLLNGIPAVDADGLRRITGASGAADIGAYEVGDRAILHKTSAGNVSGHISRIDHPVAGASGARVFATPNFNVGGTTAGVAYNLPYGVWFAPPWSLFNENFAAVPLGAHFNLRVPAAGSGLFTHLASASNVSGSRTEIDNSAVNGFSDRIILVSQNWTAGSVYNPHPVGVSFAGDEGTGRWSIHNLDGAALPVGTGYNVYAQLPSPNAFRVSAGELFGTTTITLDHRLLNGIPCAQVQATRFLGPAAAADHYDVTYSAALGRWQIKSYATMPFGTQFHVLVDAAQVAVCTDVIFADGFA